MKGVFSVIMVLVACVLVFRYIQNEQDDQWRRIMKADYEIEKLKGKVNKLEVGNSLIMVPYKVSGDTSWYFNNGFVWMQVKAKEAEK